MSDGRLNSSMFNTALIAKCFRDGRWLLVACSIALYAMMWARGYAVALISMDGFQTILDILPSGVTDLFPVDYEWLITYTGRVALAYEEPIIFICLPIWCLARSSDCISGQLSSGTLEMLLAQPIGRLQFLVTHSAITILGVAVLSIVSWLGLFTAIETSTVTEQVPIRIEIPNTPFGFSIPFTEREVVSPLSEKIDASVMWAGTLNFFCTGVMLAAVTTLISAFDRYRWRTLGISVGFYIVQTLFVILAAISPAFSWLSWLSILSAYKPSVCIAAADLHPEKLWSLFDYASENGAVEIQPLGFNLLLVFVAVACYVSAAVVFQRRELPAPV